MIDRLVAALRSAELDLDWRDLADVLWLATANGSDRPGRGDDGEPGGPEELDSDVGSTSSGAKTSTGVQAPPTASGTAPGEQDRPPAAPAGPSAGAGPTSTGRWRLGVGSQAGMGLDVGAPPRYALPSRDEIGRALRPLKQKRPSARRQELDAEATVEQFCDTAVMVPVLRRARERWFEVAVVVDAGATMVVWHDTVAALGDLLERHGAFRGVTRWSLVEPETGAIAVRTPSGLEHEPLALVDVTGRRLVLVVTDCAGPLWTRDAVWSALREWGRFCPVALVQLLPDRMWAQTPMGEADVAVRSRRPGEPNAHLDVTQPWWWDGVEPLRGAVPVVGLDGATLDRWARMVMGTPGVTIRGVPGVAAEPVGAVVPTRPAGALEGPDLDALGDAVRSSVSAEAYRLATLLSAVAVSLPVARIVMERLLPEAQQVHLAELLATGVLRASVTDASAPEVSRGDVTLEFSPGAREVLQQSLTTTAVLQVWRAVAPYLQAVAGSPQFSLLLAPERTGSRSGGEEDVDPMLRIAAELAARLGLADTVRAPLPDEAPAPDVAPEPAAAPAPVSGPDATVGVGRMPRRAALIRVLSQEVGLAVEQSEAEADLWIDLADDGSTIDLRGPGTRPVIVALPVTGPVPDETVSTLVRRAVEAGRWLRLSQLPSSIPGPVRLELTDASGAPLEPVAGSAEAYQLESAEAQLWLRGAVHNEASETLYVTVLMLASDYTVRAQTPDALRLDPGESHDLGSAADGLALAVPPGDDVASLDRILAISSNEPIMWSYVQRVGDALPFPAGPELGRRRWAATRATLTLTRLAASPLRPLFSQAVLAEASGGGPLAAGPIRRLAGWLTDSRGGAMADVDIHTMMGPEVERGLAPALQDSASRASGAQGPILLVLYGNVVDGHPDEPLLSLGSGTRQPEPASPPLDVRGTLEVLARSCPSGALALLVEHGRIPGSSVSVPPARILSRPPPPTAVPASWVLVHVTEIAQRGRSIDDLVDVLQRIREAGGVHSSADVVEHLVGQARQEEARFSDLAPASPRAQQQGAPLMLGEGTAAPVTSPPPKAAPTASTTAGDVETAEVPGFLPSRHGWRFANPPSVRLPLAIDVGSGVMHFDPDLASLAGGMVYASADYFTAGLDVPGDVVPPKEGSPLWEYLIRRLADSWRDPGGGDSFHSWRDLTDDTVARGSGVIARTAEVSWPLVREDLRAGRPSALMLVTVRRGEPVALNHHVLAYGYERDGNEVTLHVYDPDTPPRKGRADVRLGFDLDAEPPASRFLWHTLRTSRTIRGFIRLPYTPETPGPTPPREAYL